MRNGDLMRTRILETAERMFFEKGYAETSVQEILEAVNLSKGGFYHHFSSKESILREILNQNFEDRLRRLDMELPLQRMRPIDKINRILREAILLRREDAFHAALLIRICYIDDDIAMREHIRRLLFDGLLPRLSKAVSEGIADGSLFTRYPGQIPELVLILTADMDALNCRTLAENADSPEVVLSLGERIDACRETVEQLIGAPFGSLELIETAWLLSSCRAVAAILNERNEEQI